jgi:hypothetical protein
VRAASTALTHDGKVALGLVRTTEHDSPLWLELESAADAERVRRALGFPFAGLGELCFPAQGGGYHSRPSALDVIAAVGWVLILLAMWEFPVLALNIAGLVVPTTLVAVLAAGRPLELGGRLTLSRHGLKAPAARLDVRWSAVAGAEVVGDAIVVTAHDGAHRVPMRGSQPREREHFAEQIRAAARRARGEGPPPPEVAPSLAVLAPRDEAHRAWLERVDAAAASLARTEGYRDLGVAEADLWSALESPDAPVPLRSAAARVLARVAPEQAGPRIAEALAREHDEGARDRIRVALEEDVEVAARELDRLDRAR